MEEKGGEGKRKGEGGMRREGRRGLSGYVAPRRLSALNPPLMSCTGGALSTLVINSACPTMEESFIVAM